MAPNWTPEQQVANDAEVEVIVFEIIESVVRWAQERRERETLEAVTKNIMEMVIDISNDSHITSAGLSFVVPVPVASPNNYSLIQNAATTNPSSSWQPRPITKEEYRELTRDFPKVRPNVFPSRPSRSLKTVARDRLEVQAILSHRQQLQPCVNEGEVFYDAEVGYLEPGDDEETSYGDLAAYRPVASSQPPSAFSSQQYGVQQVVSQQNSNQQVTLQQESTSTGNTPPALGPPLLPMTVTQQLPTIITEADAQAGRAVYPVSAPVIVQTTEGLYTMTGGQVYWNGHNRAQRLQNVCSNNRGIGCSTPKGRNEHIRKAHSVFNQPNAGDQTSQYYEVL
ncbi:hypothetical protein KCU92_g4774, partial [Aureobasidium melanogenum]